MDEKRVLVVDDTVALLGLAVALGASPRQMARLLRPVVGPDGPDRAADPAPDPEPRPLNRSREQERRRRQMARRRT